ncbi:MAG: NAD(P)-dependent oxidoreductase, partial [Victivallaceae bacterium]
SRMKPGVMLINTSRGALICAPDLIAALKSGQVGSAGLDVYEEETDYFFEDYSGTAVKDDILARLMTFPNVMITSHQAFFTQEALANIAGITLKNIDLFFTNGAMPNGICNKCEGSRCPKCPK